MSNTPIADRVIRDATMAGVFDGVSPGNRGEIEAYLRACELGQSRQEPPGLFQRESEILARTGDIVRTCAALARHDAALAEAHRKADLALAQTRMLTAGLRLVDDALGNYGPAARLDLRDKIDEIEAAFPEEGDDV